MKRYKRPISDQLAAILVVLLVFLTALNNAVLLFFFSLTGLAAALFYYRGSLGRGGALAATAGFVTAFVLSLLLLLR